MKATKTVYSKGYYEAKRQLKAQELIKEVQTLLVGALAGFTLAVVLINYLSK